MTALPRDTCDACGRVLTPADGYTTPRQPREGRDCAPCAEAYDREGARWYGYLDDGA